MKLIKYSAIAFMAVCLASCGGKKESAEAEEIEDEVLSTETTDVDEEIDEVLEETNVDEVESSDEDDSYASSSSDSEDWDSLLDSYEEYVDKYIAVMKKVAKGDMSAMSEYPALMEKAEEFSDKIEDAQEKMPASQWERYMKITTKMATAASQM